MSKDHSNFSQSKQELDEKERNKRERIIKQLAQVVCICKGIPLSKVLPGLKDSDTVLDVNHKTGCGSGGCKGQRCGPKILALLEKRK